ncbi:MAG TPA: PGPGW domain-containing protein [Rubrobacter sp.]|nr:PGPGW domain-containing protein [Rubrobacter sp.]
MTLWHRILGVIEQAKEGWRHWRTFKEIDAGHRYQSRYHFHQRRRRRGEISRYRRPINLIGGPILITAGFVFIPTPGPSYIIIALGLWMLAGEFLPLARLFDRMGVRLGKLWRWIRGVWRTSPSTVKVLVVLAFAALLVDGAYTLFAG